MLEIVKQKKKVAEYFDVSNQTVETWIAEGLPREPHRGKTGKIASYSYDLHQIENWRAERADTRSRTREEIKHDVIYREYKALKMKLDYEQMADKFILKEDVEKQIVGAIAKFRKLLSGASKEIVDLVHEKNREDIRTEMDRFFRDLVEKYQKILG